MPETSTTGFEHPTIDSLPFDNDGAGVDPIYLVHAAPQDPVFLSFDMLPRNTAGITETSSKEGLTEALPAAVTPDSILQSYGAMNSQEPFNAMVNVASVDQGVQNTWYVMKNLGGVTSIAKLKCKQWPEEHIFLCMSEMPADICNILYSQPTSERSAQGCSIQP
jgi:hypothetical protein